MKMDTFIKGTLVLFFLVLSINMTAYAIEEAFEIEITHSSETETTSLYQHLPIDHIESFLEEKTSYGETCNTLRASYIKEKVIPFLYANPSTYKIIDSDARIEVLRSIQEENFALTNELAVFPACSIAFEYERYGVRDVFYHKERMDVLTLEVDQGINIITGEYKILNIDWLEEKTYQYNQY